MLHRGCNRLHCEGERGVAATTRGSWLKQAAAIDERIATLERAGVCGACVRARTHVPRRVRARVCACVRARACVRVQMFQRACVLGVLGVLGVFACVSA
jgi:hypothetical protein